MSEEKRGRPPVDEPRSVQVFVRFSEREARAIDRAVDDAQEKAREAGAPDATRSSVIRSIVLKDLAARGFNREPPSPAKPKRGAGR